MFFASKHVFQPKTEDDAFEEVDEKELDSSWATSSPVYLDKEAQPVAAAQPSSQLRRVETAEASVEVDSLLADLPDGGPPPAAGVASASAEVSMPLDDALDASAALTTLQEDDYRGFASKHSAVAEDKPVDEVQQSGSLGDSLRGLLGMGKASSAPAAPPPPPPPAPKSKLKLKYARAALPRQSETSGRRVRQEVDTNVVSVKLGTLVQDSQVHSGECTQCKGCEAALSHYSRLCGPESARVWKCEFCGVENAVDLDDEELPTSETVDYILKPAPAVVSSDAESNVIFCVDTSGSMCVSTLVPGGHKFRGSHTESLQRELASFNDDNSHQRMPNESRGAVYVSRLQAVQAAVDSQLTQLAETHPYCRCGLVTFNSEVTLVGDGSKATATLGGDTLTSAETVRTAAQAHANLLSEPVKSSAEVLSKKLFDLEEGGQTALGPAVCASIELAASAPGSRVVICTDGLANIGVGTLEDEAQIPAARAFYGALAAHAVERGVSISIVTIDGTEADLDSLECLSDQSGGDVEIVDPLKLADNFSSMLSEPVVASKVEVTMKLHKGLSFRHEDAACSSLTRRVGNVNKDSETMFEFKVSGDKLDLDELPFQVQIRYTAPSGMEALRVISQKKPVTQDRQEALKTMNVAMCAARATQVSSFLASRGRVSEAKLNSRAWRHTMASHVCSEESSVHDQKQYANYLSANADVEDSYAPPVQQGRRSDSQSRWQFKGKKATSKNFM